MMAVYGYVLATSSNWIADGSELLLAVLDPGIIGGFLLPVMGAVPDAAMVLFSGLGPQDTVQEELSTGLGTLAGSTIMLLTIPWSLCTYTGRVDLVDKATLEDGPGAKPSGDVVAAYKRPRSKKLTVPWYDFAGAGTEPDNAVMTPSAVIMLVTTVSYIIIQGPSFKFQTYHNEKEEAKKEGVYALVGFVLCGLFFVSYSVWQVYSQDGQTVQAEKRNVRMKELAKAGNLSIDAILSSSAFVAAPSASASAGRQQQLLAGQSEKIDGALARLSPGNR